MPTRQPPARGRDDHWRTLSLMADAPECVIAAAYRYQMSVHHPDRGGDTRTAQRINAAHDELRGRGARANEHVAKYLAGEPWHVLGLMATSDRALAERAGEALRKELASLPRLRTRVDWAVKHFAKVNGARPAPPPPAPPPPRVERRTPARPKPQPGRPDGLPADIDFGTLARGAARTVDIRLTWHEFAPYAVTVDASPPFTAAVRASKAVPGRFVLTVAIDWDAAAATRAPSARGLPLEGVVSVRWPGGEARLMAHAIVQPQTIITASPLALDLGEVRFKREKRASLLLVSTADTAAEIETTQWLTRVDAAGRAVTGPLRLRANAPLRVALAVRWEPIETRIRGRKSRAPVRPTGTITVRWGSESLAVSASMVVILT